MGVRKILIIIQASANAFQGLAFEHESRERDWVVSCNNALHFIKTSFIPVREGLGILDLKERRGEVYLWKFA